MRLATSVLLAVVLSPLTVLAQEPTPPPSAVTPASPGPAGQPAATASSSSKNKSKEIPSFLIIGTVFNEHAYSFPGVEVRIRRGDQKKFRWDTYTDSRGEFAVRVPPGYQYVVVTHVKKYADQTQNVDSTVDVQKRLSIKLEPQSHTNGGAKS
jgi:Carboxypeptidase regulatory-like domain